MNLKECNSCKQEIREDARKCHYCGTPQGYKNVANIISIYAGAFIAVAALATMAIDAGKNLTDDELASLNLSIADINANDFNFVVSNTGSKPGVVYDLTIQHPPSLECSKDGGYAMHRAQLENSVIEPGKTQSFSIKTNNLYEAFAGFDPHALSDKAISKKLDDYKVCSAKLTYLDFDNTHKSLEIDFHCNPQGICPKKL